MLKLGSGIDGNGSDGKFGKSTSSLKDGKLGIEKLKLGIGIEGSGSEKLQSVTGRT